MSQNFDEILQPIYGIFSSSQVESVLYAWLPTRIESFSPFLKTNIYAVDTFIITGIVTILIAFGKIFHKVFSDILAGRKRNSGAISVVVEYNTLDQYGDTIVNKHHQGLSWLISQKAKEKKKGAYIMVPDLEIDYKWGDPPFFNVLPQTDVEIEIEHEGRKYNVSFVGANNNDNNRQNEENNGRHHSHSMSTSKKLPSILINTIDEVVAGENKNIDVDYMSKFLHNVTKLYLAYEKSQRTVLRSRYEYNSGGYWSRTCTLPDINGLQTVALKKEYEELIPKDIETFMKNRDFYCRVGFPYRRGYLLHGRPGTGKTSLVNAIAAKMNRDLYFMNLKDIKGDSELLSAFSNVPSNSIVVFEDVDTQSKVLHNRAARAKKESLLESFFLGGPGPAEGPSNEPKTDKKDKGEKGYGGFGSSMFEPFSLSTVLSILDGRTLEEGILFIMTTNHSEILDPAVVRPGRLDVHINLDYCTHYQLNRMYQIIREDDAADLHDIYPDFDKDVTEYTLPPCEVMQMMVLHREEPELIKKGLVDIIRTYCDGSIWEDDTAGQLAAAGAKANADGKEAPKETTTVDLNDAQERRTIAVQVCLGYGKEFGIQAGQDPTIKLQPRKPKEEGKTAEGAAKTETTTTTTETTTAAATTTATAATTTATAATTTTTTATAATTTTTPTMKTTGTGTDTQTEDACSPTKEASTLTEALSDEGEKTGSSASSSSRCISPIGNGKLVSKAVEAIRKAENGDGRREEDNTSEDGFSVVPSPM